MSSPLHVAVAAGAAGSSLWFQVWPIAALGAVAYTALVASDLASPEFWKRTFDASKQKPATPSGLDEIKDPALRRMAADVRRARHDLDTVVKENAEVAAQVVSV